MLRNGLPPWECLYQALAASMPEWNAEVLNEYGNPLALFGLGRDPLFAETANPWMMISRSASRYPVLMVRAVREVLRQMNAAYPLLRNVVDGRNRQHAALLDASGCRFLRLVDINDHPFVLFERVPQCASPSSPPPSL